MRIESGDTTRGFYFVAVDATDLKTRETGLSSFTVYRERGNGTAAAMTTPTITEADATNMPGVYFLLCDEDMDITAGAMEEAMVYHITQASMAPVTREITLYKVPGSVLRGTAQAGAAGTITLPAAASATDDFYTGGFVEIIAGTGVGTANDITDYVGSTKVATVARNWPVTPDNTSVIRVYSGVLSVTTAEFVAAVFARTFDATKMSGLTFEQIVGLMASVLLGKASGLDTTTAVFRNLGDTANAVSATVDADGNRSAVTLTSGSVA